jgi:hypothetical protein
VNAFGPWWDTVDLPSTTVPMALVCAVVGAFVLSMYTRWLGPATAVINGLALFAGAYLANVVGIGLNLPFERFYVAPILLSFAGMSVTALLVLLVFARNRDRS